jgi:preprotein translocase subunit SecA
LFHGISVGCIEKYERKNIARRLAYNCDVTFGSSSSFIFDYLFDNMALRIEEKNQPRTNFPYRYAIIDELDSILIDEAQELHIAFFNWCSVFNELK